MRAVAGVDAGDVEIFAVRPAVFNHGRAVGGKPGGQGPAVLSDHGNVRLIAFEIFLKDRVDVDGIHEGYAFARSALFSHSHVSFGN